jgi:hypothetical protein
MPIPTDDELTQGHLTGGGPLIGSDLVFPLATSARPGQPLLGTILKE